MVKIRYIILLLSIFTVSVYSTTFKVASYNVENFFDLNYDKTEYKEFHPNTKSWNKKAFYKKLSNIAKVLKDLNSDIVALQEIESQAAFNSLKKRLNYKYSIFIKNKQSAIGLGLLSRFPIIKSESIKVDIYDKHTRNILKATIHIQNKPLIIFVNHWRSKRAAESKRVVYGNILNQQIQQLINKDFIILGDLNSNYNEYQTFKYDKKLNDTYGLTAINDILHTTNKNNQLVTKKEIILKKGDLLYNLWLELPKEERYSTKFRKQKNTPDNIIISSALFDNYNISYVDQSFNIFKPPYLFKNGKIFRWNNRYYKGYSDHLPIYALFSTSKQTYNITNSKISPHKNRISYLYSVDDVTSIDLNDIIVIYKANNVAIIKQKNDRAILIYKPNKKFQIGYSYNITVNKIETYNGLKEIKRVTYIARNSYIKNYKMLYLDGSKIDLYNNKYQNEIITNLNGIYKKGYLYLKNQKQKRIKLYLKKGVREIKNGTKVTIKSGHLGIYRSQVQIVIYKNSDILLF